MPADANFKHLNLVFVKTGDPIYDRGGDTSQITKDLKELQQRAIHAQYLNGKLDSIKQAHTQALEEREANNLPVIPAGIPVLLKVDPETTNIDYLRTSFSFEIVSEQKSGTVIVATEDINFEKFSEKINGFSQNKNQTGTVAQVHEILFDVGQIDRLKAILSEKLFLEWPTITDTQEIIADIGIACSGIVAVPKTPARTEQDTNESWARKHARWKAKYNAAYEIWDEIKRKREQEIQTFVEGYHGTIISIFDESDSTFVLPDSLNIRIKISGQGFKDLVLHFPYIMDALEPEDIVYSSAATTVETTEQELQITPPLPDSAKVCVIDSGVQEGHPLLSSSMDRTSSTSFLKAPHTDASDYVGGGGHGTRVAGAILFKDSVPHIGTHQSTCWLQNVRVLDDQCKLPNYLPPALYLKAVVEKFALGENRTKIFNHSIGGSAPCRTSHMTIWGAAIDYLSDEHDILFIQSAGNIDDDNIIDHWNADRFYPQYLLEPASRISNPAQSLLALTVGSVAIDSFDDGTKKSFASRDMPSSFSRTGLGIWGSIKPEVVEYGGDSVYDTGSPPSISNPPEVCPELVRSTRHGASPLKASDAVGTSFSAPKIAHIAAQLQNLLPAESPLLYKALIVQSARWPNLNPGEGEVMLDNLKHYGFGIANINRALSNSESRVTLYTPGPKTISARTAHLYKVPVPAAIRRQGGDHDILIEVTMTFSASPKRTRKKIRHYFSTWVDWKTSKLGESENVFINRCLKDEEDATGNAGEEIPWMLNTRTHLGKIVGARRNAGSTQKDWAVVKSHSLPDDFMIAVVGHEGWDIDPEARAGYSLVVSFEALNGDLPIYNEVRLAVDNLAVESITT